MNTHTLGRFCTARIRRADIDVASRAVDMNSRARQLCYPRSNFSVIPRPHQGRQRSSLSHTFVFGFLLSGKPIRLTFAFALSTGFLTRLSQPLGPTDMFSAGCHPSQTVCLLVSFLAEVSNANPGTWCYIVAYRMPGSMRITAPTYAMQQNPCRNSKL